MKRVTLLSALVALMVGRVPLAPVPASATTRMPGVASLDATLPGDIARGPGGNMWFTVVKRNTVGRITPRGHVTLFSIPTPRGEPLAIAAGPDGNVWFSERAGNRIGRITPAGRTTEFALPRAGSKPLGIAAGPDGNLWFVEEGARRVGRITPRGAIAEFALPAARGATCDCGTSRRGWTAICGSPTDA